MKSLLISLALFIPAASALAEAPDYQDLIELYRAHPEIFESPQTQAQPFYDEEVIFLKLIQIKNDNPQVKTLKADVTDNRPRSSEAIT
jgi:hypothetical protein